MSELAISSRTRPWTLDPETQSVSQYGQFLNNLLLKANSEIGRFAQDWDSQIASALADIAVECANEDWDGEDAKAITPETLDVVGRVGHLMFCYVPRGTPCPDIVPEHDGEVVLTWTRKPNRVFSVSIGSHKKLNYAGRLGAGDEPHDVERFDPNDPTSIRHLASFVTRLFR